MSKDPYAVANAASQLPSLRRLKGSTEMMSKQSNAQIEKMDHYLTVALIFFSIAWFCLTVGVFTINPVGPTGIFFLCVGLPCVAISIFYFVRYARISKKIKEASDS